MSKYADSVNKNVFTPHYLLNQSLFFYFSIVLVGGDGFYHEAVNTLELKVMEEKGLDENVPEIDLQQIPLPIGIVPAGIIYLLCN